MEDESNKDGAGDADTTTTTTTTTATPTATTNGNDDNPHPETSTPENAEQSQNDTEKDTGETDQSEPTSTTHEAEGEPKPDSVSGSPRVQFGAGTKEKDGSQKGVQRLKRSFKDIVLTEVMKADPQAGPLSQAAGSDGPPPKGILKVRSEPILDSERILTTRDTSRLKA